MRRLRVIKSDPKLSDIIVFILSARGDLETKLNCLALGAEEYLVKPIQMEELVARIRRFFQFMDRWKLPALTSQRPSLKAKPLRIPRIFI